MESEGHTITDLRSGNGCGHDLTGKKRESGGEHSGVAL